MRPFGNFLDIVIQNKRETTASGHRSGLPLLSIALEVDIIFHLLVLNQWNRALPTAGIHKWSSLVATTVVENVVTAMYTFRSFSRTSSKSRYYFCWILMCCIFLTWTAEQLCPYIYMFSSSIKLHLKSSMYWRRW